MIEIIGVEIPYSQDDIFVLADLMGDVDILGCKEDIEDVCDAADKQVTIQKKLDEIGLFWDSMDFLFSKWKMRDQECVLDMNRVNDIMERLDEDQLQLSTTAASRYVGPFKELVLKR